MSSNNQLGAAQKIPVMAHLVLGYPTLAESLLTARQYMEAGVAILELQIPFSHPTADGTVITQACRIATEQQHVKVQDCIDAIAQLRSEWPDQEIIVMSYLNRVYAYGFQRLLDALSSNGIRHLIVPDLPVDSALAVTHFGNGTSVRLVPVLAANVSDARLDDLCAAGFDFFYLMSDFKITGSGFSLNPRLEEVIQRIKSPERPDTRVGIGFGISNSKQAQVVTEIADVAIIGSALITAKDEGKLQSLLTELQNSL